MQIGSHSFATADEAKQFVRAILAKYPFGTRVTDPEDENFLAQLIKRNPEFERRFSPGIESIEVVRNPSQKATELRVTPSGGTAQHIPWVLCVLH